MNGTGNYRRMRAFARDDRAQAMVEFIIVFPVVLFLFLMTWQIFELVSAFFYVDYAAFCAARSYSVYGSDVYAEKSAAMATLPLKSSAVSSYGRYFRISQANSLLAYAAAFRETSGEKEGLAVETEEIGVGVGDRKAVIATVFYDFPLRIPLLAEAWELLNNAPGKESDSTGRFGSEVGFSIPISAACIMGVEADGEFQEDQLALWQANVGKGCGDSNENSCEAEDTSQLENQLCELCRARYELKIEMKKAKNNLDACKKGTNDCSALLDDYTTAEKKYDQSVKNYKSIQGEIDTIQNTNEVCLKHNPVIRNLDLRMPDGEKKCDDSDEINSSSCPQNDIQWINNEE
jgi:hypothetical protein